MNPEPVDLTPVDLRADPAAFERLVASILRRAEPELARRAREREPIFLLAGWARPALAAAAVLAVASAALLVAGRGGEGGGARPAGITDALAVPAPVSEWVSADRDPTVSDVLIALEGEVP